MALEPFTPSFFYKLVQLNDYSVGELVEKNDELSLVMLINRIQDINEFRNLELPENYLKNLSEHSTDELLSIISKITETMLRHINIPEDEVEEFTGQVKERKMGELFENFKDFDLPAARRKAQEKGWREGLAAGKKEGLAQGRTEGRMEGHAEGRIEGLAEGRTEGEELFLISIVCKKLLKGKKAAIIADELEEDESKIYAICQAAGKFAPDYNPKQIWKTMHHETDA